jgi:hypothetical protein
MERESGGVQARGGVYRLQGGVVSVRKSAVLIEWRWLVSTLGPLLVLGGVIAGLVGGIWLLVEAFRVSADWGLACLFLPFVGLFFLMLHWDKAARPCGICIAGVVALFIGAASASGNKESISSGAVVHRSSDLGGAPAVPSVEGESE